MKYMKYYIFYFCICVCYLFIPFIMKWVGNDPTDLFGIQYILILLVWPVVQILLGIAANIWNIQFIPFAIGIGVGLIAAFYIEGTIVGSAFIGEFIIAQIIYGICYGIKGIYRKAKITGKDSK